MKEKTVFLRTVLIVALYFLAAGAFLAYFSFYTSPFFPCAVSGDSVWFRLVGTGMLQGKLPFRDFFDNKGPYIYMLEALGQLLCPGKFGAFLLQWFALTVDAVLAWKTAQLFCRNQWLNFLVPAMLLPVLVLTFEGGGMTEELSLPLLLWAQYAAFKWLLSPPQHTLPLAFGLGVATGLLVMVRITNAAGICACTLVLACTVLLKKDWLLAGKSALCYFGGALCAMAPAVLFFAAKGLLADMLYQMFVFGMQYSNQAVRTVSYFNSIPAVCLVLLLISLPTASAACAACLAVEIAATTLACNVGHQYPHYFVLFAPVWVGCFVVLLPKMQRKVLYFLSVPVSCLLLVFLLHNKLYLSAFDRVEEYEVAKKAYAAAIEVSEQIPEAEWDSVYGYVGSTAYYSITNTYSPFHYCDFQDNYAMIDPRIGVEIDTWMSGAEAPKWVLCDTHYTLENQLFLNRLASDYQLVLENYCYRLYKKMV